MKKFLFKNPKFIKSAVEVKDYPYLVNLQSKPLIEIAVAGRSNVGKSSLLNHLFQVKNLVKTSSTPGKTQLVNFFTLNEELSFADLPGYGFAKVPKVVKLKWGPMMQNYLEKRQQLQLILFLIDIRRLPTEDDLQLLDWIIHFQKPMILVLTKTDKLTQSEKLAQTNQIVDILNCTPLRYVHYSITKNEGREKLIQMIQESL